MHEFTQSVRLKAVLLPVRMVGNRAPLMAKQIRPTIRLTPINWKADILCEPPFDRRRPERLRRVDERPAANTFQRKRDRCRPNIQPAGFRAGAKGVTRSRKISGVAARAYLDAGGL